MCRLRTMSNECEIDLHNVSHFGDDESESDDFVKVGSDANCQRQIITNETNEQWNSFKRRCGHPNKQFADTKLE